MKGLILRAISFFLLLTVLSCTKQDWSQTETLAVKNSSDFEEGAALGNNTLEVDNAEIFVSAVHIIGERIQSEGTIDVNSLPHKMDLMNADKSVEIDLPIGSYQSLSIAFEFSNDGFLEGEVNKINGNPDPKPILIPLDLKGETVVFDVLKETGQDVLTITENNPELKLTFNLQKTLNDVGVGAFNGLVTASQSQTGVDINTIAGQNFLSKFKKQLLENSSLIAE
jgi:hypothetical protein